MTRRSIPGLAASAVSLAACFGALAWQDRKAPAPPAPTTQPAQSRPDPAKGAAPVGDEQSARAMDAATPGAAHKRLAKLSGDWEIVTRIVPPGATEEDGMETKGRCNMRIELDGRFVHETGVGEMMGVPTRDFKLWGFNNGSGKYEGVWTWTFSTGLLYVNGESKDDGKTIEWLAHYDDQDGKRQEFRILTTFKDDDHFSQKIYGGKMPDGSPGPTMYVSYSRKK